MEKVKLALEAPKETYELLDRTANFVAAMRVALADGWQFGSDLPTLMSAAISDLIPALSGTEKISAEWSADPQGVLVAASVGGAKIVSSLLKKG
jgi:hypothetical protein